MISMKDYRPLVRTLGEAMEEIGASEYNQAFELGRIKSSGNIYVGLTTSIPVPSTLAAKVMVCIKEYNKEHGTNIELLRTEHLTNAKKTVLMLSVEKERV